MNRFFEDLDFEINQDIQNIICNKPQKISLYSDFARTSTYRMRRTVNLILQI